MYMNSLTTRQREFFRSVAQAAFANPFSVDRAAADRLIADTSAAASDAERVQQMVAVVSAQVAELERGQKADIRLYGAQDREILLTALLFEAFHRFIPALDRLIEDQLRAGSEPVPARFARELLGLLAQRGYSSQGSLHFLAVFFQLRRAYYFIARGLAGHAPCLRAFRERLWQNVFTRDIRWYERYLSDRMEDFSTLLLGETGTGKGAAAAAIGRSGYIPFDERRGAFAESFTRNFIALNLSQYPEALIESELFGHRKGAFTGAIDHHEGVFARCSPHGAIFLDEIGDVPVPLQIKLLQVLQDRTFTPVGSHEAQRFSGRVIAATNRPLDQLRRDGRFRDDFYYRLCSDVIEAPTLRRRVQEDPAELTILLRQIVTRVTGDDAPELADDVRQRIEACVGPRYHWPGNVRELEQAARRVLLTGRYDPADGAAAGTGAHPVAAALEAGQLDAEGLLAAYCRHLHERHGTYEEVARRTRLDRRTVKKYILRAAAAPAAGA